MKMSLYSTHLVSPYGGFFGSFQGIFGVKEAVNIAEEVELLEFIFNKFPGLQPLQPRPSYSSLFPLFG